MDFVIEIASALSSEQSADKVVSTTLCMVKHEFGLSRAILLVTECDGTGKSIVASASTSDFGIQFRRHCTPARTSLHVNAQPSSCVTTDVQSVDELCGVSDGVPTACMQVAVQLDGATTQGVLVVCRHVHSEVTDGTLQIFSADAARQLNLVASLLSSAVQRCITAARAMQDHARSAHIFRLFHHNSAAARSGFGMGHLHDVVSAVMQAAYSLTCADRVSLFLVDEDRTKLVLSSSADTSGVIVPVTAGLAGWVATHGASIRVADAYDDERFNKAIDASTGYRTRSVATVPILASDAVKSGIDSPLLNDSTTIAAANNVQGVLQAVNRSTPGDCIASLLGEAWQVPTTPFYEDDAGSPSSPRATYPFTQLDLDLLEALAAQAGGALKAAQTMEQITRTKRMTAALLDVLQAANSDSDSNRRYPLSLPGLPGPLSLGTPSMSAGREKGQGQLSPTTGGTVTGTGYGVTRIIDRVIDAAYALLDCERVTLFLLDPVKKELWMAVSRDAAAVHVRIPVGRGLAGTVAESGVPLNVSDAYCDARFDKSWDVASGFHTYSVLVWPISVPHTRIDSSTSSKGIRNRSADFGDEMDAQAPVATQHSRTSSIVSTCEPAPGLIAVLQAINKRSRSLQTFASGALKDTQGMHALGLPAAAGGTKSRAESGAAAVGASGGDVSAGEPQPVSPRSHYADFDSEDERAMAAFCSEVARVLKKRTVEAALLKAFADAQRSAVNRVSRTAARVPRGHRSQSIAASVASGSSEVCVPTGTVGSTRALQATPTFLLRDSQSSRMSGMDGGPRRLSGHSNIPLLVMENANNMPGPSLASVLKADPPLDDKEAAGPILDTTCDQEGRGEGAERMSDSEEEVDVDEEEEEEEGGGIAPDGHFILAHTGSDVGSPTPEELQVSLLVQYSEVGAHYAAQHYAQNHTVQLHMRNSGKMTPSLHHPHDSRKTSHSAGLEESGPSPRASSPPSRPQASSVDKLTSKVDADVPPLSHSEVSTALTGFVPAQATATRGQVLSNGYAAHARYPGWSLDPSNLGHVQVDERLLFSWSWNVFELPLADLPEAMGNVFDLHQPYSYPSSLLGERNVYRGEQRLQAAVYSMMDSLNLFEAFRIPRDAFACWLSSLRALYHAHPFHNWYHAVAVAHAAAMGLRAGPVAACLTQRDVLAALVAALGHDVDHPGVNNAYQSATLSPLALLHNDDAVLERHHASTLWRLLLSGVERDKTLGKGDGPGAGQAQGQDEVGGRGGPAVCAPAGSMLCALPYADLRALRRTVVRAVLHTDMGKHFGTVEELGERASRHGELRAAQAAAAQAAAAARARRSSVVLRTSSVIVASTEAAASAAILPFDPSSESERDDLVAALVHAADLSGQAYPLSVSANWSQRITVEFRAQAAAERAVGLVPAPFMDSLVIPLQAARLQVSFVGSIVLPLWQRLSDLFPAVFVEPLANLQASRSFYEAEALRLELLDAAQKRDCDDGEDGADQTSGTTSAQLQG